VAEGPANLAPNGACRTLRVIGQVARTYLVCEADDRLVILDQHAADERVRFDRLRAQYAARSVSMQRLLVPERFEVSAEDATRIEEEPETFAALGIDVTRIGETTIAVHAVPALVGRAPAEPLVRDLLSELARAGERTFGDAIDTMLATMACHGAIRAGDALSPEECRELVRQLEGVRDFASHCPHGRPVAFEISFTELGRRVGR
jgi:DNA mismatch repair protein MutL